MRNCTRIKESTPLNKRNIRAFLRRYAKKIPLDSLEFIEKGSFGASFTFYYDDDKILKINKPKSRPSLIKEAKLAAYLHAQQLPFHFAQPIEIHPKGFYVVFSRIDAQRLTVEKIQNFSPDELESFAQSLAAFLSFLHGHTFPDDISKHIPRPAEDLALELRRAESGLEFIRVHATDVDTSRFEESLDRLKGPLQQTWAVAHGDFTFGNILLGQTSTLTIIDFAEAERCDPCVDFAYFAEDLEDEGIASKPVIDLMLKHYQTNDESIAQKIEFRLLAREISSVFRRVRKSVRQSATIGAL